MSYVSLYICDICKADGYLRKAIASYEGDNQKEFHCCKKHLKDVTQANLPISYLNQPSLEVNCLRI